MHFATCMTDFATMEKSICESVTYKLVHRFIHSVDHSFCGQLFGAAVMRMHADASAFQVTQRCCWLSSA